MKANQQHATQHPKTSNGKKWAAANRKKANHLSDEQRAALLQRGQGRLSGKHINSKSLAGRSVPKAVRAEIGAEQSTTGTAPPEVWAEINAELDAQFKRLDAAMMAHGAKYECDQTSFGRKPVRSDQAVNKSKSKKQRSR